MKPKRPLRERLLSRLRGVPRSWRQFERSLQLLAELESAGWQRSIDARRPLDAAGEPLPWFTYPAIDWLRNRVRPSDRVFEFGGGGSTMWFARRVREVITVEHDPRWSEILEKTQPDNVHLFTATAYPESPDTPSPYVRAIESRGPFDIIVIDGVQRPACVVAALNELHADGILVLDDSHRPAYQRTIERILAEDFWMIEMTGFSPGLGTRFTTGLFGRSLERWLTTQGPLDVSKQ